MYKRTHPERTITNKIYIGPFNFKFTVANVAINSIKYALIFNIVNNIIDPFICGPNGGYDIC